jgi:hypothetical protein
VPCKVHRTVEKLKTVLVLSKKIKTWKCHVSNERIRTILLHKWNHSPKYICLCRMVTWAPTALVHKATKPIKLWPHTHCFTKPLSTPRLPVADWTDTPTNLNGLVHFADRLNPVSARVLSHLKCRLLLNEWATSSPRNFLSQNLWLSSVTPSLY